MLFGIVKKIHIGRIVKYLGTFNNCPMQSRFKIAVIGAGSFSHSKHIIDDLLTIDAFVDGFLVLMDPNPVRLAVVYKYAQRVMLEPKPGISVGTTSVLEQAIDSADIVISVFDVGGSEAFARDYGIVKGYGLNVCIGDTAGPLGSFRALRNGVVMLKIARTMKRTCPKALLINYVNPMAPMVSIASSVGVSCVGVCGGIESTKSYVASVLGKRKAELQTLFAGVNHLCWLLELKENDRDVYPDFRVLMNDPDVRGEEAVRFEILQQFGYFLSESSGHASDFFPYFRRDKGVLDRYCYGQGYSGAEGAYLKLAQFVQKHIGNEDYLADELPAQARSQDYCPWIIEAWMGSIASKVYGNIVNSRFSERPALIGLPPFACVEVPLEIERRSIVVPSEIELPLTLSSLCMPLVLQHALIAQALLELDAETVFSAICQDQLTSAVLDLPQIRSLTHALLEANARFLPYELQSLRRSTADAGIRPKRRVKSASSPEFELVKSYERWRLSNRVRNRAE